MLLGSNQTERKHSFRAWSTGTVPSAWPDNVLHFQILSHCVLTAWLNTQNCFVDLIVIIKSNLMWYDKDVNHLTFPCFSGSPGSLGCHAAEQESVCADCSHKCQAGNGCRSAVNVRLSQEYICGCECHYIVSRFMRRWAWLRSDSIHLLFQ